MSTSQAIYAGWMEIPFSAVNDKARTQAEEETLAALVSQYAGTLYRVAFSVLRNPSDAEDAVQETFLRVLRHRDTLDEVRDQRVWLIRIVWNIVLDRKRRAKTRPETDDVSELARVLPAKGLSAEQIASAAQHMRMCWPAWTGSRPRSARCSCSQLSRNLPASRLPRCWGLPNPASAVGCSGRAT